jgi:hypothetical protein
VYARLAALKAAALGAYASTRLAALALALLSPEPLLQAPLVPLSWASALRTAALAGRARLVAEAVDLGSSAVPLAASDTRSPLAPLSWALVVGTAAFAVRTRLTANTAALGSSAVPLAMRRAPRGACRGLVFVGALVVGSGLNVTVL